jgi:hypothetical protein
LIELAFAMSVLERRAEAPKMLETLYLAYG